ncbi:hypothetical protein MKX03_017851 [Papaver bracteatum]|nr:hypothetical protein MKX03_017851 [Papaver bracteatum]
MNITIRGLTLEQLEDFDDVRGYVFHIGEIIAFDQPVYTQQGTYEMTVRISMNIFNTLRESTVADNGKGGLNTLTFEYHELPYNFCEFCRRLGQRHEDCAQYRQAQNLVQNGYQLPAPPGLYPPLHQQPNDEDMEELNGNADDKLGFFHDGNDTSSTNSSTQSVASNKSEISISDHNEAILPEEDKNIADSNPEITPPLSPPYVVNPLLWDEFGFFTPEPTEPIHLPNVCEITWDQTITSSAKRPNPSNYVYSFRPEELEKFDPMELYTPTHPDPSAASSFRDPIWPTIDDYRAWILQEPNKKRRKLFKELAAKYPAVLVDIYQAESSAPPDSPPVRPDTVPMDIFESLAYEEHNSAYQDGSKEEFKEELCVTDRKGKGIMKEH